jgi:hypothetical protein
MKEVRIEDERFRAERTVWDVRASEISVKSKFQNLHDIILSFFWSFVNLSCLFSLHICIRWFTSSNFYYDLTWVMISSWNHRKIFIFTKLHLWITASLFRLMTVLSTLSWIEKQKMCHSVVAKRTEDARRDVEVEDKRIVEKNWRLLSLKHISSVILILNWTRSKN